MNEDKEVLRHVWQNLGQLTRKDFTNDDAFTKMLALFIQIDNYLSPYLDLELDVNEEYK
jgi:hypothetical protein